MLVIARQDGPSLVLVFTPYVKVSFIDLSFIASNPNSLDQESIFVFMCFNYYLTSDVFCLLIPSCLNFYASQDQYELPIHMETWALGHNKMSSSGPFDLYNSFYITCTYS